MASHMNFYLISREYNPSHSKRNIQIFLLFGYTALFCVQDRARSIISHLFSFRQGQLGIWSLGVICSQKEPLAAVLFII